MKPTGVCRTGRRFAWHYESARPDIMCLGKALGGGIMPISAIVADHEVMDVFTPGTHGSTFGGNPLADAIGVAAIEVLEQEAWKEKASGSASASDASKRHRVESAECRLVAKRKSSMPVCVEEKNSMAYPSCLALKEIGILAKLIAQLG